MEKKQDDSWVKDLTPEQIYWYVIRRDIIREADILRAIQKDFAYVGEKGFLEFITKPTRVKATLVDFDSIPTCCGICVHYGSAHTFASDVCVVHADWPEKRAFFDNCMDFEKDATKFRMFTTRCKN